MQDQNGNQVYIGITHLGVVTFQGTKRTRVIYWCVLICSQFRSLVTDK